MSDVGTAFTSLFSFEELLTPQFLCPVCGVIVCAIIVFFIGVGFKSSSEPKFENAGEGDGVPFIKKKKKLKTASPPASSPKKVNSSQVTKVSKKREEAAPEKPSLILKPDLKQEKDVRDSAAFVNQDEWITPVTRKEKKARRRQELSPEKENETLILPEPVLEVSLSKKPISAPVDQGKQAEQTKTEESPAPQRSAAERKGRAAKLETAPKTAVPPPPPEAKLAESITVTKEEDAKGKKASKQKQKVQQADSPQESAPAPTAASPAASLRSKKKKGAAAAGVSESTPSGGFPLAEFELPSAVVVPPAQPPRKTPSPPSTDSSFELVDADAVREAIEAEHQEPSKTSGASRRKTKKPSKGAIPAKVKEEVAAESELPPSAPVAAAAAKAEPQVPTSSNVNFDELGGSIDDWQDAKPSRKRRRARRDD